MLASVLTVSSTRSALKDKNKLGPRLVRVFPAGLACLLSLFWCGHFIFGSVKRPCGHMKLGRGELQRGSSRGLGSIWFLRFMSTPQVAPSGRELCFNPPGVEFNVEFMGFVLFSAVLGCSAPPAPGFLPALVPAADGAAEGPRHGHEASAEGFVLIIFFLSTLNDYKKTSGCRPRLLD